MYEGTSRGLSLVVVPTIPQSPEAESPEDHAARVIQKGASQPGEDS